MKLLIQSKQELSQVISLNANLTFDKLIPHLRAAQLFLTTYVGRKLLDDLASVTGELTATDKELLTYVQVPLANLAMLKYAGVANVLISDMGLVRTKDANTNDAFEWQVDRTVSALLEASYEGLEQLLRYLEENLTDFPAYTQSKEYNLVKNQLIKSADVFNHYYGIGHSRLVFETLNSAMCTAEIRLILPALKTAMPGLLESNLTVEQTTQLDAARRALVYATMARALKEKLVMITPAGVMVNGISQFATVRYQQAPTKEQLESTLQHFEEEAATYLADLITLITPPDSSNDGGSRVSGGKIVSF